MIYALTFNNILFYNQEKQQYGVLKQKGEEFLNGFLKGLREERGLRQKKVAEMSGITQQMYSFIENGSRRPSVEVAKKIVEVLDFDWTRFFD